MFLVCTRQSWWWQCGGGGKSVGQEQNPTSPSGPMPNVKSIGVPPSASCCARALFFLVEPAASPPPRLAWSLSHSPDTGSCHWLADDDPPSDERAADGIEADDGRGGSFPSSCTAPPPPGFPISWCVYCMLTMSCCCLDLAAAGGAPAPASAPPSSSLGPKSSQSGFPGEILQSRG